MVKEKDPIPTLATHLFLSADLHKMVLLVSKGPLVLVDLARVLQRCGCFLYFMICACVFLSIYMYIFRLSFCTDFLFNELLQSERSNDDDIFGESPIRVRETVSLCKHTHISICMNFQYVAFIS